MICLRSDSIYQKLSKKHFSKILANIFDMCQIFWPNFFQIHEFEISARANRQIRSNPSYFCNFQYVLDACDCLINSQRNLMSLIVHNCRSAVDGGLDLACRCRALYADFEPFHKLT